MRESRHTGEARPFRAGSPLVRRLAASPIGLLLGLVVMVSMAHAEEGSMIPLGSPMPPLRGDLLDGRNFVLPDSARGSELLLLLGFSYKSRHDVDAWAERFRKDFASDSGIRCYEIPLIGGAGRLARPFINRGMRRGTPRALHDRVMTIYGGTKPWKQAVGFSLPDVAYVLLVDRAGRLVWRGRGPFDDETFRALAARIRQLGDEAPR